MPKAGGTAFVFLVAGAGQACPMMIMIEATSPVPPYEQVRVQLARQIGDRTLVAGTRLPTVRQLAADLGLAVNTVARSYRELEDSGLVETRGRAGTFVSATGDQVRVKAQQAAERYAATVLGLGLDAEEAVRLVSAALHPRVPPVVRADEVLDRRPQR